MTRPAHPLGFVTKNLPFKQLSALVDALTTVVDVVSGLQEQPRFGGENDAYNKAGGILEDLRNNIGCEIDDIREEVHQRPVQTREDRDYKFDLLLGRFMGGGDHPATAVAELATIAAAMDWELSTKAGAK